jgi:hypothetical protein
VLLPRRGWQLNEPAVAWPRHRGRLAALAAGVLVVHLWLAAGVLPVRLGEGAADSMPRRLDIHFVRTLQPAAPPAAPAAPPATPGRATPRRVLAAATPAASSALSAPSAASAPEPDAPPGATAQAQAAEPDPAAAASPSASQPAPTQSAAVTAAASASPPEASASAVASGFEWPPSTRLSYRVTGNFRGPVEGQAQVEWLRSGARYQVVMEIAIGPSFAPLVRRRVASDGEITATGLHPRRYDEETKLVLVAPRLLTIFLDEERVRLPGGGEFPRPAGVQDSASQFVQLTWLFTTQPQLLQPGRSIDIPLALPRRVETWTYDVLGPETLWTPAGPVDTVHVKPRRELRGGGDLAAEMWVAPTLQYLPVRILIRQDAETYVDLNIEQLPEQAAEPR